MGMWLQEALNECAEPCSCKRLLFRKSFSHISNTHMGEYPSSAPLYCKFIQRCASCITIDRAAYSKRSAVFLQLHPTLLLERELSAVSVLSNGSKCWAKGPCGSEEFHVEDSVQSTLGGTMHYVQSTKVGSPKPVKFSAICRLRVWPLQLNTEIICTKQRNTEFMLQGENACRGASELKCSSCGTAWCRSQPIRPMVPQANPENVYDIKYYSE